MGTGGLLSCLLLVACEPPTEEMVAFPLEIPSISQPSSEAPSSSRPPPAQPTPTQPAPTQPSPTQPPPTQPPPEVPQGRAWFVSTKGRDDAAGTREAPLRTIGRAVERARPGEVIRVLSGVYPEELILGSKGSGVAAITVRGEGSPLPTVAPGNTRRSTVIRVQGRWNLENLRVDVGGKPMFAIIFESGADGSTLSGSELRSGTLSAGVLVDGPKGLTLRNNTIHHFIKPGEDSHGVVVVGPSRDVVIRDNDIHHNSGDSVQCQAGTAPATGLVIENNTLHDEGENGVDIKQCDGVIVRGNVISSLPNTAIRAVGSSAGEAVVVHLSARNVTVEDNTITNAGRGISILEDAAPPAHIRVEGNHLRNLRDNPQGNGFGIRVEGGRDVVVVGNTVEYSANYALMLAADGKRVTGLEVRDNTLRGGADAPLLRLGGEGFRPDLVLQGNFYSLGGILKADGVLALLEGPLSPFRVDFPGERLTLTDPDKLQVWRQVMGVDTGTALIE
ncbi:putative lipoprotein [Cystobacter fuscus DSM 2262]|uniref:Lipoprotein n=1 Tax=Cystobacter fuscus (strain ATCC 25194 / DSM 2262 / NBRC 100088 / M29) TaxID=1242864 RepID=S9PAU9_CYSF2|nr:putative lipoprotein [Cystobacter fuscus DSM 2262]